MLPINHTCSSTLRIRAQEMTAAQLSSSCSSLANQDAYFHGIVADPGPVAERPQHQPRSGRLQLQHRLPDLRRGDVGHRHQQRRHVPRRRPGRGRQPGQVHRLRGRVAAPDLRDLEPQPRVHPLPRRPLRHVRRLQRGRQPPRRSGGSKDSPSTCPTPTATRPTPRRSAEAAKRTYALSTLFDTTYSHDSTRIYRWGYLAVRYMLQSHRSDMTTVLNYYRSGNWNAARTYLRSTIGTRYNTDWYNWLSACAAGNCGGGGGNRRPPPVSQLQPAA